MRRVVFGLSLTLLSVSVLTFAFDIQPVGRVQATLPYPMGNLDCLISLEEYNPTSLPPIDWLHYHNYTEVTTILLALNDTYPNIVDVFSIGKSWWNQDIYCVRLTNESEQKPKPEVFFVGYHHAREQISSELPLYFVVYTATNFGLNETITELINNCEIYVVVALMNGNGFVDQLIDYTNPEQPRFIRWEGTDNDGDYRYAEDWIGGVDLNRNYGYAWEGGVTNPRSEVYRGPAAFSEPETQAIRDFVLRHDFMYAISFHSGIELILYPWAHTYDPPPDEAEFIEIAQGLSSVTGGTPYGQSISLYPTHGVWDDWMYGSAGVLALTCEIFANETWEGTAQPGSDPNTVWEGGLKYWFNPFPENIESVVLHWLPVFFYLTNRTINEAVHNVAIDGIITDREVVGEGYPVGVNVSIQNKGYFTENFNVSVYANDTILQTQSVTLTSKESATITFTWNTTGFSLGDYTIKAIADQVPGETDIEDNEFIDGIITVSEFIHDIAVTGVTPQKTIVCQGYTMRINVTVENKGDVTETFNVTIYWNTTEIDTEEITLASGSNTTITFYWNTTGLTEYQNYTISAYVHPVPGEIDINDNIFNYSVRIVHEGDVNGDGKVRVDDVLAVALHFGTDYGGPPNSIGYVYDPNLDINCDGKIRVDDVYATAQNFGYTKP